MYKEKDNYMNLNLQELQFIFSLFQLLYSTVDI